MIPNINEKEKLFYEQNKRSLSIELEYLETEIIRGIKYGYGSVRCYISPKEPVLSWILSHLTEKGYTYKVRSQLFYTEKRIVISWNNFNGKTYKPSYYGLGTI